MAGERYVGLLVESSSVHYAHREFSHTEIRKGREVNMYHCWCNDPDEVKPAFSDNLEIKKVKQFDRWIRDNPEDL